MLINHGYMIVYVKNTFSVFIIAKPLQMEYLVPVCICYGFLIKLSITQTIVLITPF